MNQLLTHEREFKKRSTWFDGTDRGMYPIFTTYDLDDVTPTADTLPAVEVQFSGFNFLCASHDMLAGFKVIRGIDNRWGITGFGIIQFHRGMLNPAKPGWTEMDKTWALRLIGEVVTREYMMGAEALTIEVSEDSKEPSILRFQLTKLVPQEVWHEIYKVKSLEMTAALKYFQSLGGQMAVAPCVPEDLKHDRTLN